MLTDTRGGKSRHILIYTDPWPKPDERNPGKMTFTTASGLLPAGIAGYVQRGRNGDGLERRYSVGLQGFTSQSDRGRSSSLLPAWEAGSTQTSRQNEIDVHSAKLLGTTAQLLVRILKIVAADGKNGIQGDPRGLDGGNRARADR